MIVHAVCFEGASSSSGFSNYAWTELSDMVGEVAPGVVVHSLDIASTRKLKRGLMEALEWVRPADCAVFVGKSLGAIRMFRVLESNCPGGHYLGGPVVSIDPMNALRLIYPYDVTVDRSIANQTINVYNRGARVRGADNRKVDSSHMEIVRSGAAKIAVMEAVKRCSE